MKKIFSVSLFLLFALFSVSASAAQLINQETATNFTQSVGNSAGFAPTASIGSIVATLISVVLGFLAMIFLVLTIIAGFKWMTAGGNEEQVKKAVSDIKNAIIGLVIVLAAYAITYFVFKYLPFGGIIGGGQVQTGS